jgi:hypothetical protein
MSEGRNDLQPCVRRKNDLKKYQPIKTPEINKRKNKNINIVYPSLFFSEM